MTGAISIHIGLNKVDRRHYRDERRLFGCHNDAIAMYERAVAGGFAARRPLLDEEATTDNVSAALIAAAEELAPGGLLLLTYAGHGAQLPGRDPETAADEAEDENEEEPRDGRDEAFCLFDRMMRDDEMYRLLARFHAGQRIVAILDCCHSSTALQGRRARAPDAPYAIREIDVKEANAILQRNWSVYAPHHEPLRRRQRRATLEREATLLELAACAEFETTPDGPVHGAFTAALLQALQDPSVTTYDALHARAAALHPFHTPILRPRDESTQELRRLPPFQAVAPRPGIEAAEPAGVG